ncbi:hypothetical protein Cni_G10164 [Canna indica]|uniref:Transposase n=1 Tax=Canna indica TaxID=4628 RepID=A0AAQ3K638_9LILI|nr:hypothetical protein Cni_G10164 [Canna indica]
MVRRSNRRRKIVLPARGDRSSASSPVFISSEDENILNNAHKDRTTMILANDQQFLMQDDEHVVEANDGQALQHDDEHVAEANDGQALQHDDEHALRLDDMETPRNTNVESSEDKDYCPVGETDDDILSSEFDSLTDEEYVMCRDLKKDRRNNMETYDSGSNETLANIPPTTLNEDLENTIDQGTEWSSEYENSNDEIITPETSQEGVPYTENVYTRKKHRHKVYNPNSEFKEVKFEIGMKFGSSGEFKQAIQNYALVNGYNIKWSKSNKRRKEAKCIMGCPWRIYASWLTNEKTLMVKAYTNEHSCSRNMRNRQATVSWIANYYLEKFRSNPNWGVEEMEKDLLRKFYITIPRMKSYRAKWEALKRLRGSVEDHYALLGSYIAQLRKVNPTSLFSVVCDPEFTGSPPIFKRLYIGFDALRNGFVHGCRPIIGFDGCFFKIFLGGQLLSAIGRDDNNQMFPIAWAVVEGENYDSWSWFLGLLFDDLCIDQGYGWTLISDQQKGLEYVIKQRVPAAKHRNCARHVYANWKKKHNGHVLKSAFWRIVRCNAESEFKRALNELQAISPPAFQDFIAIRMQM